MQMTSDDEKLEILIKAESKDEFKMILDQLEIIT